MKIQGVVIEDTFAEAWDLEVVRLVLTAISSEVAWGAAQQFTGAAGSSELGSRFNAGIERAATPAETPDCRPGVLVSCTMPPARRQQLVDELALRLVLATLVPTCAVYDAMVPEATAVDEIDLHALVADRWQGFDQERQAGGRRLRAVPTTTAEFVYEQSVRLSTAGTDGHIVCYAATPAAAVMAVSAAKEALVTVDGVAPMGYGLEQIYRELDYVPALRYRVPHSKVPADTGAILNLLMFGATAELMKKAMGAAIRAAAGVPGVQRIGAMNFGGAFGRHQFHLRELV